MATPGVAASILLYEKADALKLKGRYARAAEKLGCAVAAAAQELAGAEDCLVVALLRAGQAEALICHSRASTLPAAEAEDARRTAISVLLPQCVSALTRRKAAGTLLPGSCRTAEVAWWRTGAERALLDQGLPSKAARVGAAGMSQVLGLDACMHAAKVALDVLVYVKPNSLSREMQVSHAAFIASAFDLMALPREPPSVTVGLKQKILHSKVEQLLAQYAHQMFRLGGVYTYGGEVILSQLSEAWRRVERSGAAIMRMLVGFDPKTNVEANLAGAAAEAAVRGLRECALASCASKEVHVSQFKSCGACRTVAYCCREHQVADWPAHKAACKAARKAAATS